MKYIQVSISKINQDWMLNSTNQVSVNKAIDKIRLGDFANIDTASRFEIELNKLKKQVKELKDFIDKHSGN